MRDTPQNHYWASTVRDSWQDVPWGIGCIFVSPNPHPAVGYIKQIPLSSNKWVLRHVFKFQPRRAKHHAKRVRRCLSANSGRLMTPHDLNPANFRRFLTVLVDRRLLSSQCCLSTGLVASVYPNVAMPCRHDQMLPVVCRILASLSHCWFLCVFSPVGWLQYSGSPSDVQ